MNRVLIPSSENQGLGVDEGVNNPFCPGVGRWKDSGQRMTPDLGLESLHFGLCRVKKRQVGGGEETILPGQSLPAGTRTLKTQSEDRYTE